MARRKLGVAHQDQAYINFKIKAGNFKDYRITV